MEVQCRIFLALFELLRCNSSPKTIKMITDMALGWNVALGYLLLKLYLRLAMNQREIFWAEMDCDGVFSWSDIY